MYSHWSHAVDTHEHCVYYSFTHQDDAVISGEFKKKWAALQKVLERQKEKGGVIDPEAESNRFLIHINEVNPRWNIYYFL